MGIWDWSTAETTNTHAMKSRFDILSASNIESSLLQAANALRSSVASLEEAEEEVEKASHQDAQNDAYWAEEIYYQGVTKIENSKNPPVNDETYWDWHSTTTITVEQANQLWIDDILEAERVRRFFMANAIVSSIVASSSSMEASSSSSDSSKQQHSVKQSSDDDYWSWESQTSAAVDVDHVIEDDTSTWFIIPEEEDDGVRAARRITSADRVVDVLLKEQQEARSKEESIPSSDNHEANEEPTKN